MQDTNRTPTRHRLVRLGRSGHRLFGNERDDGVDLGIHTIDLRKVRGHSLARRHLLAGETPGQLDSAHLTQL